MTGRLAAATLAAVVFAVATVAAAGSAEPHPSQPEGADMVLEVLRQTAVVAPDGQFELDLRVVGAPPGARISSRLRRAVRSRSAFGPILFGRGLERTVDTLEPIDVASAPRAPGGGLAVALRLGLCSQGPCGPDRLQLSRDGVYPLEVILVDDDDEALVHLTTFVVRLPDEPSPLAPLVTSLVLPLHARPSLRPDGTGGWQPSDLAPVDIVVEALIAHPDARLTIAPTPETIESLAVENPATLQRLRPALGGGNRQVVADTYVDLAVASWVSEGLGREVAQQQLRGINVLDELLPPTTGQTWIADASLSPAATGRLAALGVQRLVIDPGALAPADPTDESPVGPIGRPFRLDAGIGVEMDAVATDPGFGFAFGPSTDPVLSAHRLIAELAVASYDAADEAPGDQPLGVVVAPANTWVPSPEFLDALLGGLVDAGPLLRTATLDDQFSAVAVEDKDGGPIDEDQFDDRQALDRQVLRRGLAPIPAPSLGGYPAGLLAARQLLDSYQSMIGDDNRRVDPFDELLLVSGARDLTADEQGQYLGAVTEQIGRELSGVEVPADQTVTLTSAEGQLPLTIRNRLDYRVTVAVELTASERVAFRDATEVLTLEPNETRSLKVDVRARASGDTPIQVTVRSRDGAQVLTTTRYKMRSTAVSGVGILLTAGAAAFLALWWVRHVRLVRAERRLLATTPA